MPFRACGAMLLLLATGSRVLPAQAPVGRTQITPAMVAAALGGAGFHVDASQVELPGPLSVARPDAQFRLTATEILPSGRVRLRLACTTTTDCQPFFATVQVASGAEAVAGLIGLKPGSDATATTPAATPIRVRAGQRATLVLEGPHMRITLPVLAIDTGTPGAEIRVTSLDRRQNYRAVVSDGTVVRGVLP